MAAAIAQKPPEEHGGVDLKPAAPAPAMTPATVSVDPEHAVALAAPAAVPQTIEPQASKRQQQLDLIAQAEQ
jgi:hypothetical protein